MCKWYKYVALNVKGHTGNKYPDVLRTSNNTIMLSSHCVVCSSKK